MQTITQLAIAMLAFYLLKNLSEGASVCLHQAQGISCINLT